MAAPVVVILAAGQGTRMRSAVPKLLHPLCGRAIIDWPVAAAREAGAAKLVVVDSPARRLEAALAQDVVLVVQERPLGTADAVRAAAGQIEPDDTVIVLNGDGPLIATQTLRGLIDRHQRSGAAATIATMVLEDPAGYGRVVRDPDGKVQRVVETKAAGDATDRELRIREVNTGLLAFSGGALVQALDEVRADNAQGEHYLPDVLPILRERERTVLAYELPDPREMLQINDRRQLAEVTAVAQRQIHERHMLAGVTIVNPDATSIDVGVEIAQDAMIEPFTSLRGATRIGERSTVGPQATMIDAQVGADATVIHAYVTGAVIGDGVSVGPFAYLRPGTVLRAGAKAGTFVEIKNSDIGAGAKVPHLSYIGDADIGEGTNLGAATITANYDYVRKNRTTIGRRVKTSVDTTLIAPVTLGDDAYTAAGSVISQDVPPGALGVARSRQENIEGYAERRHAGESGSPAADGAGGDADAGRADGPAARAGKR